MMNDNCKEGGGEAWILNEMLHANFYEGSSMINEVW